MNITHIPEILRTIVDQPETVRIECTPRQAQIIAKLLAQVQGASVEREFGADFRIGSLSPHWRDVQIQINAYVREVRIQYQNVSANIEILEAK